VGYEVNEDEDENREDIAKDKKKRKNRRGKLNEKRSIGWTDLIISKPSKNVRTSSSTSLTTHASIDCTPAQFYVLESHSRPTLGVAARLLILWRPTGMKIKEMTDIQAAWANQEGTPSVRGVMMHFR